MYDDVRKKESAFFHDGSKLNILFIIYNITPLISFPLCILRLFKVHVWIFDNILLKNVVENPQKVGL